MLKNIKFKGGCFSETTELNLFDVDKKKRITILYGKNGSGKSTLSKAVMKAFDNSIEDIESSQLIADDNGIFDANNRVHVYNEDYIEKKVRITDDGLNAIVLLDNLGDIEDHIKSIEKNILETTNEENLLEESINTLSGNGEKSISFLENKIRSGLSGDGKWAERSKRINNYGRNDSVNSSVLTRIMQSKTEESVTDLNSQYQEKIQMLEKIRSNNEKLVEIKELHVNYDNSLIKELLSKKIEMPNSNEIDDKLSKILENTEVSQMNRIRHTFEDENTEYCPYCFQKTSSEYKNELISILSRFLSNEYEDHIKELEKIKINEVTIDLDRYKELSLQRVDDCLKTINEINGEISKINSIVQSKIENPYKTIEDFDSDLSSKIDKFESERKGFNNQIVEYNNSIDLRDNIKDELKSVNDKLAFLENKSEIENYLKSKNDLDVLTRNLNDKKEKLKQLAQDLDDKKSEKKKIKIAVDLINNNLKCVFFSPKRLELKVENDKYVLYSNGQPVKPNRVSTGERNIIALCYFFVELLSNQTVDSGYPNQMVLVIDDPVSSFDMENRVGIMSLLRNKLNDIFMNEENQVLVMTHDLQCFYDLEKIVDDIDTELKANNAGRNLKHCALVLKSNSLENFDDKNRNVYSNLLKIVYDYAKGNDNTNDIIVGNSMRRVLEAFGTFTYKKGIDAISRDSKIVSKIEDVELRDYFSNLMYRLILNGDSHMLERIKAQQDILFVNYLSDEERRKTAKSVICFIYLLNEQHLLSHLNNEEDIEETIKEWVNEIKNV